MVPDSLELMAPNEVVHLDYMTINKKDVLGIKDKATGWIYARLCKDKTVESSVDVFHRYITAHDRSRLRITDEGPGFQSLFTDFLYQT